jgi:hypothetical protein
MSNLDDCTQHEGKDGYALVDRASHEGMALQVFHLRELLKKALWQLNQPEHGQRCTCRELAQDGRFCNRHTIANTISYVLETT